MTETLRDPNEANISPKSPLFSMQSRRRWMSAKYIAPIPHEIGLTSQIMSHLNSLINRDMTILIPFPSCLKKYAVITVEETLILMGLHGTQTIDICVVHSIERTGQDYASRGRDRCSRLEAILLIKAYPSLHPPEDLQFNSHTRL